MRNATNLQGIIRTRRKKRFLCVLVGDEGDRMTERSSICFKINTGIPMKFLLKNKQNNMFLKTIKFDLHIHKFMLTAFAWDVFIIGFFVKFFFLIV